MHSFEADSPCPGRGSGWNPPPGVAESTTGAMGEDARGAVGENATGAIGNDAPGAMGRADWPCWNPFPGMAENTTGAMGEDAPGAVGGNATGAIGNDAPGAMGEDAIGALKKKRATVVSTFFLFDMDAFFIKLWNMKNDE